jgi:hypothetical protein
MKVKENLVQDLVCSEHGTSRLQISSANHFALKFGILGWNLYKILPSIFYFPLSSALMLHLRQNVDHV